MTTRQDSPARVLEKAILADDLVAVQAICEVHRHLVKGQQGAICLLFYDSYHPNRKILLSLNRDDKCSKD